jgi:N-acetyl-gamma-glutamyl-phosphate reductase
LDSSGRRLVLISCLDNLGKGAAGQAVQNLNHMLGIEEQTSLQ